MHTFFINKSLFAQALTIVPYLFSGGFSRMIYEHFSRCFIPKDPSLRFSELFQTFATIIREDISRSMALMLGVNRLLVMAKDIGGLCPVVVNKVFFLLIIRSIVLKLQRSFQEHLSPHQFGTSTPRSYEAIPFGV
jgi:hypothetical protein